MESANPFDANRFAAEIAGRFGARPAPNTAAARAIRREFSRRLKGEEPVAIVGVALRLLEPPTPVPRFVAYELICHHRSALASLDARQLEKLAAGMDNWGDVDAFACFLSGPAWRQRQLADGVVYRWVRSDDPWWRRAALVSTVPLNNKTRGGGGDARRTLAICRLLLEDRDDMVVKAMSWALRELAKPDPKVVAAFLRDNESRLAARVVREVRNKLRTGLKNPRKT
jgi:3-methyladenine DNA glycosylase AlkD